ncbi:hypothetical protein CgunFtcFv8_007620 [Champsocephalus gunnari]|uniref:Uncharacterized protein n=1 Tax=Champsocephalus gunnari TaxID=52237 RepID=A0AAN8CHT5_CHAGU|nr:hypothetical protein CgunFtcFv8_007620 [Champsocephalus gunnari]
MQACSPASYTNKAGGEGEGFSTASTSSSLLPPPKKKQGLMQNPAISVSDYLASLVKSATRGKRIRIPEMSGLQCSFAHFLCLIKNTRSQRLEQRGPTELRFKASLSCRREVNSRKSPC